MPTFYVPTRDEFKAGLTAYEKYERRGPVYFEALGKLREAWGSAEPMADAIWLLLESWHRQFYRFGRVDLKTLATCIEKTMHDLDRLRSRENRTFCTADEPTVKELFRAFTVATYRKNNSGLQESTVATAKALHLVSPGLLPLWDNRIAWRYGCSLMWAEDYISFCWLMKEFAHAVKPFLDPGDDRTLLKRIDEFNYAAYTKRWIAVSPHTAAAEG
jgi:hypothetical protein